MKTTPRNALLACLLFAPFAQGATETAPSSADAAIDQVVIEANRATVAKLEQQVKLAEVRFYQRYNELNTKRDYMVNCRDDTPTGSRFTVNYCRPVFQEKARQAEGQAFALGLAGRGVALNSSPGAPASMGIAAGRPGFQQNMVDITRRNPDLLKLLNEYGALVKQYEDAYRRINGATPAADESPAGENAPASATPAAPAASSAEPTSRP